MGLYMKDISNTSYTNKDFNTIYPELLDLADRLSPTWKPSESNEGDAGIVILKLDALMADKNNYNIDKNILELFPESVTQYGNAREIYSQCGYIMPYYVAAEVDVSFIFDKDAEGVNKKADSKSTYKIPRFTMITNDDKSIVYTTIEELLLSSTNSIEPGNEGQRSRVIKALQGKKNEYTLNSRSNNNIITYEVLY